MIWDRLPKSRYVSFTPLQFRLYDAVANFNIGRKASVLIFENFGLIPGKYTVTGCQKLNQKRLSTTSYKKLDLSKKGRKIRRGKVKGHDDKNQEKEGKSYEAGACWTLQLNFIIVNIWCFLPGFVSPCYYVIWNSLFCT